MSFQSKTIDIIIPVYGGYTETLVCLNSVLNSEKNNKSKFNIIVINDCSPIDKLVTDLQSIVEENSNIKLLHNEENLGFVSTVNRGMTETSNDVILLNSDTEVANNWVDKLYYHADKPNVASVTPFSNNATICSYPKFCEINAIPAGESVASIDDVCRQANNKQSIQIPTAVGFCMYIPRQAINKIGLFDYESFGKGYGEENDFCCRAIKLGMHNLFALDTFVKHEGGVSFAGAQSELQAVAGKVLLQKHPEYNDWVAAHIKENPANPYREKIDTLLIQKRKMTNASLLQKIKYFITGLLGRVKQ